MKRKRQHAVAGDVKSIDVVITVQIALMGAVGVADFPDLENVQFTIRCTGLKTRSLWPRYDQSRHVKSVRRCAQARIYH